MPDLPSIVVRDLVKTFRLPGSAATVIALDLPKLEVKRGETVAIIGPSGSGKTTLLNIIAGLLPASQGEVFVNGTAIHTLDERARDRFRARTIGYVFQAFNLLPAFSAIENVRIAMDLCHVVPARERQERARLLLVPFTYFEELRRDPRVAHAIALAMGDSVRGFRLVGVGPEFFELADPASQQPYFALSEGRAFETTFEAVL